MTIPSIVPSVGLRSLRIADDCLGISFPAVVLYPADGPSAPVAVGPYTIDASADAPVARGRFPVVLLSHGNGGSHLAYRTMGLQLARNGYIVAMPEHYGNNRNDNHLEGTHDNLVHRPRHARMTIDAVLAHPRFGPHALARSVAAIGHSIGGYTALALAGGEPWSREGQPVAVEADPRVRALVLLAPATPWYLPEGSLHKVRVPILMLIAEHDPYTPRWQADLVVNGVFDRRQVTLEVVPNAGHFSFLSPFPPEMCRPGFLPCTDPDGFDREAFHAMLPGRVLEFLGNRLAAG